MRQLELPLDTPADASAETFLIGDANAAAVQMLERRDSWPVKAALIVGPRKSGRSRLARLFAGKTGAVLHDDAELADETRLFHAWNRAQAEHRLLLMVAHAPPPQWRVALPDLRSRLNATPVIRIHPPDDALIRDLLQFWFEQRQIFVRPDVIEWLSKRTERSYVTLLCAVDAIEAQLAGARDRRATIPRAKSVMGERGLLIDDGSSELDRSDGW